MALATIAAGGAMGFIRVIQSHSRCESLSAATERRTVSILFRVIMLTVSEQNMSSDHTYSTQRMATAGQANGGVFNLRPSGCPVPGYNPI
ncbi:hypothetical protein SY86_00250 [Erwinia tracheiphila]|uniref:Uncharacterized protein n=1 Tax=Erwinia tracheiphila TaxID=65700 RepID=A0A0M2KF62_9GAMM|nr:hypothetical protein SY86_00250 [Erwinia tracheiphila]